ncbi:holin [Nocardiopsis dassonvillei]|uniref:holin n=1 Tax=Nocardiopsis dassonvillei TaxID=2014 RepID=UPI0033D60AF4
MFTTAFWKGAAERAVKSAAQALILLWGVGDGLLNLWSINPTESAGIAAGAVVLSVLTSLISLVTGPTGSPSMVQDQPAPPPLNAS